MCPDIHRYILIRGVTILQILDSITFWILRSRFDSILDYLHFLKKNLSTGCYAIFRLHFYAI